MTFYRRCDQHKLLALCVCFALAAPVDEWLGGSFFCSFVSHGRPCEAHGLTFASAEPSGETRGGELGQCREDLWHCGSSAATRVGGALVRIDRSRVIGAAFFVGCCLSVSLTRATGPSTTQPWRASMYSKRATALGSLLSQRRSTCPWSARLVARGMCAIGAGCTTGWKTKSPSST